MGRHDCLCSTKAAGGELKCKFTAYMCCMFTTVAEITEMLQGVSGKPFFAFIVEVHTAGLAFWLSAKCGLLLSAQYTQ